MSTWDVHVDVGIGKTCNDSVAMYTILPERERADSCPLGVNFIKFSFILPSTVKSENEKHASKPVVNASTANTNIKCKAKFYGVPTYKYINKLSKLNNRMFPFFP